ncbi:hypothetical protein BGK46_06455 [Salinivibrio sp. SS2]|nr:hypothetical protein BGK46_06455 [Salinivibrio sp. DV]
MIAHIIRRYAQPAFQHAHRVVHALPRQAHLAVQFLPDNALPKLARRRQLLLLGFRYAQLVTTNKPPAALGLFTVSFP